jgi:hypothetical protein
MAKCKNLYATSGADPMGMRNDGEFVTIVTADA